MQNEEGGPSTEGEEEDGMKGTSTKFVLCARNYGKNFDLLSLMGLSQYMSFLLLAPCSADKEVVS